MGRFTSCPSIPWRGIRIANGDGPSIVLTVVVIVFGLVLQIAVYASRYKRVPPNQALVVYGRKNQPRRGREGFVVLVGGGKFIMPIIETFSLLSLAPFVVEVKVEDAGKARCELRATARVTREPGGLRRAASNLLDKPADEVRSVAATILEGHARGLLGRGPPPDASEFVETLETAVRPDYEAIGLELVGRVVVRSP